MAGKPSHLSTVKPGEKPAEEPKRAPSSVSEAVDSGSPRDQLVAMRSRIAKAIDEPNIRGADLAALSRRLLEIGKEIAALDAAANEEAAENDATPDDEFDAAAV